MFLLLRSATVCGRRPVGEGGMAVGLVPRGGAVEGVVCSGFRVPPVLADGTASVFRAFWRSVLGDGRLCEESVAAGYLVLDEV